MWCGADGDGSGLARRRDADGESGAGQGDRVAGHAAEETPRHGAEIPVREREGTACSQPPFTPSIEMYPAENSSLEMVLELGNWNPDLLVGNPSTSLQKSDTFKGVNKKTCFPYPNNLLAIPLLFL